MSTIQPFHIPYFKSMLERNWADGDVLEMSQSPEITCFIFKRNYFSSNELTSMCKYCKIDPEFIIEWQVEPHSTKRFTIKIFVRWTKDAQFKYKF